MRIIKLIFFMILVMPLMLLLSGCFDDSILDAIISEKDFIAPFDVVLPENQAKRTTYFEIADTGNTVYLRDGDDSTYINIPVERSFSERLNVNLDGDDVVDDNVTGLTWTKCTSTAFGHPMKTDNNCAGISAKMSWSQAVTTCTELDYAGENDWRLPTLPELLTLVKAGSTDYADLTHFPDTKKDGGDAYWTYTSRLFVRSEAFDISDNGWIVYFGGGGFFNLQLTTFVEKIKYEAGVIDEALAYVRCVRGGLD